MKKLIPLFLILFLSSIVYFFTRSKPVKYLYTENHFYQEQMDMYSVYDSRAEILMIGNSLIAKIYWNELLNRPVINMGIGSDITKGFLDRLKFIKPGVKICFIEGGVNDLARNIPQDSTVKNLNQLIDSLLKKKIIPVLTNIIHVTKHYPDAINFNNGIIKLNKEIQKLSRNRSVYLIDINPSLCEGSFLKEKYSHPDGIHLKANAYLIWKAEIEKAITTLLTIQ